MKFISQVSSMPPPEEWIENKIECKILGKILYQWKIGEAECEKYWLMIVRDDYYNYYNITTATPKEMYQKFHESPDGKTVTVTHETCLKGSKIPLLKDISYYFTIRKFYIQENFAIKIDNEKKSIWEELPWCTWNLIDSIPQEEQKVKLVTNKTIEENKTSTDSINIENTLWIALEIVSTIYILLFIYIIKYKFWIYKKHKNKSKL